ncbi:beta strand repeat-containing protein [Dokdonia sp. Asnod3-C12]|uniref:beta strand repeat-containing protein n=1 Tax=Dokdonia sp. Asnod3-C12 TaxID=3160575 RepID=UPI0038681434
MKKLLILSCFLLLSISAFGQVKIGDNPNTINGSSLLELESTNKVLVATRVSTSQMNAITPLSGGLVFNTDENCFFQYTGSNWQSLCQIASMIVDNNDGTYTYTDANGNSQIINTQASSNPYDNSNSGLVGTNVQDAIDEVNTAIGNVTIVDNGDGTYNFTDPSGTTTTIADTSISTLVDNGDGTYTYTDETGATQIIDTTASGNIFENNGTGLSSDTVQEAIEEINAAVGTVALVDNGDGTYDFTDASGTTTTITDTSISTLVDNGNGTYTYTDETGATQIIDTNASANPYDNTTSGLTATNVQDAIDEITGALSAVNVTLVDNGDGTYTFTDVFGNETTIADTSVSTLVDNADGTYTYTDETGATQVIDTNASANPYDNTTSGLAATNVQDAIDEINAAAGTVALVDNGDGTYSFTDASGTTTTIADTSISTLVDNADGTYTYTDETGATQVIDTNASANPYDNTTSGLAATNVQDAIDEINAAAGTVALVDNGDGTYSFTDASGTTTTIADTSISTLVDNADGTYTYTDETGATQVIDTNASANPYDNTTSGLAATNVQDAIDEINAAAGTVALVDNGDGTYSFTDASGTTTTIADTSISTLVDNADGTYTYTDETGATQVIDTNASANPYDNTTSGLAATNVQDAIDEINAAAGTVALVDNGDGTYDFTDASGTTTTIADTSISTLVDNADGTYTYTDETGATQVIDTNASANPYDNTTSGLTATNVQDAIDEVNAAAVTVALVDNGDGTYDFTDASGTTTTIADTSVSTLVDNTDGTYTYTDETGATQVIDTNASANPYDNTTSGLAATNVQDAIDEINAAAGTVALVDNGDGTYDFTDASGTTTTIADTSISTLVDNADGTYTYTDETGATQVIDTNASANPYDNTTSGLAATNVQDAIDEINAAAGTVALVDNGDGTYDFTDASGTTTTIADTSVSTLVDNGNGTYGYTDETGITTVIDTNGFNITNTVAGNTIATVTDAAGNATDINETVTTFADAMDGLITYTDENGDPQTVAKSDITDNGNGTYTFTNNDGSDVVINTNGIVVADINDGKIIATITEADGTLTNIEETVTAIAITAGELTYANEDATNANVNLISTDTDNNITAGTDGALFVDVSAEETVTDVTDLNAAASTNLIGTYNNEEGDPFAINETVTTVTATATTGNTIATYTNEDPAATPVDINETVTAIAIAAGELTYANEDATNANVNLISADADNNITAGTDGALFVDVSAEETVTDVTDLNAAASTNLIGTYNNEEGDPFTINETVTTVTATALTGNTIATYTNEDPAATPVDINETVTELAIAAGELTYANEDATNDNVNLISADADNNITAGTDGALFVDVSAEETVTDVTDINAAASTNLIGTYNNEEGDPFAINETVTAIAIAAGELTYANEDATNANVNLISADADNNITAGTDGALFVDVSAEETVTDVTDLNAAASTNLIGTYNNEEGDPFAINETVTAIAIAAGELTYANEDATNANVNLISADADNNITAGTDGALFVDVSAEETVTDVTDLNAAASTNLIGTYNNEEGDPFAINETVTAIAIAAGELTYANEDATNANVNLISADADNNVTAGSDGALFVDVSAEETVTDVTDLNAAASTNLIGTYNNEEGDPFAINETVTTVTATATTGNTIATYTNEDPAATPVDINETVTAIAIAAGELTYANEDATNANVNLISADADNNITAGTDGALFVDVSAEETVTDVTDLNAAASTNLIGTYNNEEGDPFAINETVTAIAIAAGELTYANEDATNANVNLISADADNNVTAGTDGALFVDVSAEETVTDVTDLNAAASTNLIGTYNNEEGDPFAINETVTTVTATAATGNTIATYTNEDPAATPVDINETVTAIAIAAGELTYANEDATNANVNLISADADNNITAGTDGALFVDVSAEETVTDVTDINAAASTNLIGTYNNEEGDPFAINETVTAIAIAAGELTYANEDATNANVNLISADADNNITAGTDGALFVDVSAEETVTDVTDINAAASTNLIGTYNNEEGDPFTINETVTAIAIAAGELTYANEDATNANVNLISADPDNNITAGTDGALFVDVSAEETVTDVTDLNAAASTNLIGTYNNEEGDPFAINETVTAIAIAAGELTYANEDATNANVNLISADADNNITAGTDGALFVDVSAEETVTDVTDLNAAASTNLIGTYNNEEGDPFAINETVTTVTATAATGNTIATYTNEDPAATPVDINETVTAIAIAAGELTYANEDATNANVNLISADADNNITAGTDGALFVDVSAEETVTDVTDLNAAASTNLIGTYNNEEGDPFAINETVTAIAIAAGELTYANEDATNANVNLISADADNNITAGTDGALFVDVSAEETVTDVTDINAAASTNLIGTYNNEEGDPFTINETVTAIAIAAGELTYANEDATNDNVNLISADADNNITAGTDGALFVDVSAEETATDVTDLNAAASTNLIGTYNNEEGDPFAINETVTTFVQNDTPTITDATATGEITYTDEAGNPFTAQVVSADADNALSVGTDGGAYLAVAPTIYATGKVAPAGGGAIFNATAVKVTTNNTSGGNTNGDYRITFASPLPSANYVIQLTVLDRNGAGNDDPDSSYYNQTADGFTVNIGDNDNGGTDRADFDSEFMFTVITIPGF